LREFDQVHFYTVDQAEFDDITERFKTGRYTLEYEETTFDPQAHADFLASVKDEAADFVQRRNAATKQITREERDLLAKWREGQVTEDAAILGGGEGIEVTAPMTASVWKIQVKEGDAVKEGQVLAILEAMKMEIRKSSLCFRC
jgi:urea carboxylase